MKETATALRAFDDFVALGPGRTLAALLHLYQNQPDAPTHHIATLKEWSMRHGWTARLEAMARADAERAERLRQEHRDRILASDFALVEERVAALNQLAQVTLAELTRPDDPTLWVRDKKSIITGQRPVLSADGDRVIGQTTEYEVFEVARFNAAEVQQFRGLLDDIAKDTGGRKQQMEHSGDLTVEEKLTDAERAARLAALLAVAKQRAAGE